MTWRKGKRERGDFAPDTVHASEIVGTRILIQDRGLGRRSTKSSIVSDLTEVGEDRGLRSLGPHAMMWKMHDQSVRPKLVRLDGLRHT
jgi:hypothetical protein